MFNQILLFNSLIKLLLLKLQENRRQQLYRQKYSQEIATNRNCADYNDALRRIEKNSDFYSFNRHLLQENKEIDIENSLFKVRINFF